MTFYQRFESVIALVVRLLISLVIIVAVYRVGVEVIGELILGGFNPVDPEVFQSIFGQMLTVLIALELNHTLHYGAASEQSIIKTKVVLLIALIALARKFIVLDLGQASANQLLGLAAITLAIGITYWLMRDERE